MTAMTGKQPQGSHTRVVPPGQQWQGSDTMTFMNLQLLRPASYTRQGMKKAIKTNNFVCF
jgi:hypothetical protein